MPTMHVMSVEIDETKNVHEKRDGLRMRETYSKTAFSAYLRFSNTNMPT